MFFIPNARWTTVATVMLLFVQERSCQILPRVSETLYEFSHIKCRTCRKKGANLQSFRCSNQQILIDFKCYLILRFALDDILHFLYSTFCLRGIFRNIWFTVVLILRHVIFRRINILKLILVFLCYIENNNVELSFFCSMNFLCLLTSVGILLLWGRAMRN